MMESKEINNRVRNFLIEHNDGETSIVDLVCEFCLRSGLSEQLVGDAIADDPELTKLIKWNMESKENKSLEDF